MRPLTVHSAQCPPGTVHTAPAQCSLRALTPKLFLQAMTTSSKVVSISAPRNTYNAHYDIAEISMHNCTLNVIAVQEEANMCITEIN